MLEQVLSSVELINGEWISCAFLENVINLWSKGNKMISKGEERKTGKLPSLTENWQQLLMMTEPHVGPDTAMLRPIPWVSC